MRDLVYLTCVFELTSRPQARAPLAVEARARSRVNTNIGRCPAGAA